MVDTMRAFGLADETASAAFLEVPMPDPGPGEVRVRVRSAWSARRHSRGKVAIRMA